MRDLSEYYVDEYLTESANRLPGDTGANNTLQQHPDTDESIEYDDLDFDLGDGLNNETYYAGGDEGDSRNVGVTPKIAKKKPSKSKAAIGEAFQKIYQSVVREQDEFGDDFGGGFDDGGEDEFAFGDEGGDEGTVEVSSSVIRDLIFQLQGLLGEDDFEDEAFDDGGMDTEDDQDWEDDFPTESWNGGNGDPRMHGNYSGKAQADSGSGGHLSDGKNSNKGNARVKARPNSTEGRTGDGRMRGDYSGKSKGDGGTSHLSGGKNLNKASQRTPYKKSSKPEEDLFGV
jgi:hypothetical protein